MQSAEELENRAKKAADKQQQRQPSDLCASLPLGVVEIIPGAVQEIVRWLCPKDMRIAFTSLVVEKLDSGISVEARLYHNDEYLGSIPVSSGPNSSFLAFKEIKFEQFDLIRVELFVKPEKESVSLESDGYGGTAVVLKPVPVTAGPMDFIIRYK